MTRDTLTDLIAGGRVRFLNAYPVAGGVTERRARPTPITWRRDKNPLLEDDREASPRDEAPALLGPPAEESGEDTEAAQQRQPVGTPFYAPAPGGRHTPAKADTRARTHQSRDSATGTTRTGGDDNVFVYEALEAGQTFQGYVALTEAKDWEPIQEALAREPLLLGRSGRAGYGGLPVCEVLSPEGVPRESGGFNGAIPAGRRFTVLGSPGACPCGGMAPAGNDLRTRRGPRGGRPGRHVPSLALRAGAAVRYTRGMSPPPTSPLQHGWHCVYDLHYHLVFTVKYRRALLDAQVTEELVRISQAIQERHEIRVECLGADRNHIHLLCATPPKLAPADIVRIYKSITARELFKALPRLRQELWGGAFWSGGYFVSTVGQRGGYEAIKRYVQSQGQTPEESSLRLLFKESDES